MNDRDTTLLQAYIRVITTHTIIGKVAIEILYITSFHDIFLKY